MRVPYRLTVKINRMKTDNNLRKIRGAAFAALTLGVLSLLGGCAADENRSGTGKGTSTLSFNVAGINDAVEDPGTRSLPAPETVSQVQDDGTVLDFTLTPVAASATRASSAMTAGNTYKYVVLDATNKVVGAVDGQAGTATSAISIPDVSQAYTIAAYSYNNTASMPSPGAVGATAGSVAGPVNTDVLYFKESLAGGTLAANSSTTRAVTFDHKYSQVTVVVDATSLAANVTAASGITLGPSYGTTLNVATGAVAMDLTGTSTPVAINFTSPNAQKVTSDPAVLFTNGASPLTLSVGSLTIGGTTYTGKSVTFSRALAAGTAYTLTVNAYVAATFTLAQNQYYFVPSVNDNNYLPYTAPMVAATTGASAPDGITETLVNYQGTITTAGVTAKIPVTVTAGGTLPAYSTTITVPSSLTEDGISRDLTLSWAAQSLTTTSKTIAATIKAVGGTVNAKKLDINNEIGNDFLGVLLGQFSYPYNNAGTLTTFQVRDIAPIPDRMIGQYDIGNTTTYEHQFLYLPVQGEDGKIWLNNNLGADYANLNSGSFNPGAQATAYTDFHAYGSLFQWGRLPDGHELINWTSGTTGTVFYGTTSSLSSSDIPSTAAFIIGSSPLYDWSSPANASRWQGVSGTNNPCPYGFRVPTYAETSTLVTAAGIGNASSAASSKLKFSYPGNRDHVTGMIINTTITNNGFYWSSLASSGYSYNRNFGLAATTGILDWRGSGNSVRCIKN